MPGEDVIQNQMWRHHFPNHKLLTLFQVVTKAFNCSGILSEKYNINISIVNTPVELGQFLMKPSGYCRTANLSDFTFQLCKHEKNDNLRLVLHIISLFEK